MFDIYFASHWLKKGYCCHGIQASKCQPPCVKQLDSDVADDGLKLCDIEMQSQVIENWTPLSITHQCCNVR